MIHLLWSFPGFVHENQSSFTASSSFKEKLHSLPSPRLLDSLCSSKAHHSGFGLIFYVDNPKAVSLNTDTLDRSMKIIWKKSCSGSTKIFTHPVDNENLLPIGCKELLNPCPPTIPHKARIPPKHACTFPVAVKSPSTIGCVSKTSALIVSQRSNEAGDWCFVHYVSEPNVNQRNQCHTPAAIQKRTPWSMLHVHVRETRANPDELRMLAAELSMIRQEKLTRPLKSRRYRDERGDDFVWGRKSCLRNVV
ncbi:hypothetical protein CLU79DRAFT_729225 [Phycomyces nitens]|nr:hypothetical protein CLU79DRAFT_729225 [Phycomyces nitens]